MKVLVIGDSCFDYYVYGKCERLSPEAPAPIFIPNESKPIRTLGMASNVYNNLKSLEIKCDIVTNIGKPIKTRYVDELSNYLIMRIDENDKIQSIDNKLLKSINFDKYDAIVISDYDKGFLTIEDIIYISDNHNLVLMDSKKKLGNWCNNVDFIKINEKEYLDNLIYLDEDYPNKLIVTLGNKGALYQNQDDRKEISLTRKVEVRDVSGAGDTFFAGFVADYLKNNDICKAIEFANKCASWVVTQRGVVSVELNKIEND